MILDGIVENGRFGIVVVVVDFNKDGVDDFVVSVLVIGMSY